MTGPASGGTERGTRAPSRATGTQGAVGAVLVVLALGLALRLIIAYLLPGLRLRRRPRRVPVSGRATSPRKGRHGFYDRDFFHDYTPGYLYVLWLVGIVGNVARRRRRPDQDPADPGRPRDRLPGLVDGPRARRSRAAAPLGGGVRAVVNPISWFDSVGLGPGRLVRRRLPPARRCASCGATGPSGRRSGRRSPRSSSRSWASSSRSSRSSSSGAPSGRDGRLRRPRTRTGGADRHPDDRAWERS